jgi:hypothetical protein
MRAVALLLLLLLLLSRLSLGADAPPLFASSAPLSLEGKGAVYALTLPQAAYRGIARRDLGDLRVLNGAGEVVPYALERIAATEKTAGSTLNLGFFPLTAAPGRPVEDLNLRVERRADGTVSAVVTAGSERRAPVHRVAGYLIDASAAAAAIRELRFDWSAGPEGTSLDARIEASDDLRSWRPAASGPLLVLRRGGTTLERRAVELPALRAKYLQLSWRTGQEDPKLSGVAAQLVDAATDSARAWLRFEGTAGAKPGEYLFELPPALPVDRLRLELPQENTLVSAAISTQERPNGPERSLASAVLYRMEHGGQKLLNPDLQVAVTAEKRWIVRVDQRGGGLGSGLPVLHAGWLPHRLLFVARGDPPFKLVFGNPKAVPAAMTAQALLPGAAANKPIEALAAKLGQVTTRDVPVETPVGAARGYFEQMDRKKLWLWGSMLLAVLVIVGMAWRLTREMPAPGEPPRPRPPGETR